MSETLTLTFQSRDALETVRTLLSGNEVCGESFEMRTNPRPPICALWEVLANTVADRLQLPQVALIRQAAKEIVEDRAVFSEYIVPVVEMIESAARRMIKRAEEAEVLEVLEDVPKDIDLGPDRRQVERAIRIAQFIQAFNEACAQAGGGSWGTFKDRTLEQAVPSLASNGILCTYKHPEPMDRLAEMLVEALPYLET